MKYIKASICLFSALSFLPYVHSADNIDSLFAELKRTKRVRNFPDNGMSEIERNEAIDKGFKDIENEIFRGYSLPEVLKKLIREAGNLRVSVGILSPINGTTSPLHDGIREGQEKKIPTDWVVFGQLTASEYFCINYKSFQIARFLVFPEAKPFKQEDTYPNLGAWITEILLPK